MSFRNRCQISGAQGVIDLSIPLVGGRAQKGLIRDVRISGNKSWQGQHWKTITACYNRSPWFEYYRDGLEALYRRPADFLLDWNQQCLEWSFGVLGMNKAIGRTGEYRADYPPEEAADWRGKLMPRDRGKWGTAAAAAGPGADRPEADRPEAGRLGADRPEVGRPEADRPGADIREWPAAPRYHQVFEERIGFTPHLSILDLLFCEGKTAIRYIRSSDDGRPSSGVAAEASRD